MVLKQEEGKARWNHSLKAAAAFDKILEVAKATLWDIDEELVLQAVDALRDAKTKDIAARAAKGVVAMENDVEYAAADCAFAHGVSTWAEASLLKIIDNTKLDKESKRARVQPIIKRITRTYEMKEKDVLMGAIYKKTFHILICKQ